MRQSMYSTGLCGSGWLTGTLWARNENEKDPAYNDVQSRTFRVAALCSGANVKAALGFVLER